MVANTNKKTWKLSPEQLVARREMLGRELDEVAKRRDELRSTQLRAAEVKELIKATDLGQEQEELKASAKDVELVLEALHRNVERLSREVLTEETDDPQDSLPGIDASKKPKAPRPSARERTLALPEHAGPAAGEAGPHEGGTIAPEAPYAAPALPPGPRHPDAVDGEIVVEAEDFDATLFRPSKHPEHLLPTLTSKGKRAVLALLREAPGGSMSEEEIRRRLRLPHVPCPMGECYYQSGDWVLKEAPKASKGKGKGKASKKEPPRVASVTPLAPPAPSASGHPQRVLRSWLWARLGQTAGLSVEQLGAEAVAFHLEYLSGTLALLDGTGLVLERKGLWSAVEGGEEGVDRVVLNRVAAALIDAPLDCNELAQAMGAPTAIVWDVLEELREQGRVSRKGKAWSLTHGAKQGAAE